MIVINSVYNYTLSSYNMQQKGRYHTFNSYKDELGEISATKTELRKEENYGLH